MMFKISKSIAGYWLIQVQGAYRNKIVCRDREGNLIVPQSQDWLGQGSPDPSQFEIARFDTRQDAELELAQYALTQTKT